MIARQRKRRYQRKLINKQDNTRQPKAVVDEKQRWSKRKHKINLNRHQVYGENPSPTRRRVNQAYHANPSPVRQRIKEAYSKNPSPVRQRMKNAYIENPSPVRRRMKRAYIENPSPVRHRVKKAYTDNPSPIRRRVKKAYDDNPSPVRLRVKNAYHQNRSPVKKRVREAYQSNPSPVRKRARLTYAQNPSPVKKRVLRMYHKHASPFKERSKKKYQSNIIASRLLRRKQYAEDPLPACKRSQLYYRQHQNEILERAMNHRRTTLAALNIRNKYNKIFNRRFGRSGTFTEYVERLTRKMGLQNKGAKMLKAQLLVRSCLQQLSYYKHKYTISFQKLQNRIKATVHKANELATTDLEVLDILCGESLHTSNTELYNCGACYNSQAFNEDGILDLEKFPTCQQHYIGGKYVFTWECCLDPPLCKLDSQDILRRLDAIYLRIINCAANTTRQYIEHIDDCSNYNIRDASLQGHPLQCYLHSPPCTSDFLYLRILAPHFPAIRHIVKIIYEVRRNNGRIIKIENALRYGHLDKIQDIVKEAHSTRMRQYDVSAGVLNENDIYKTYKQAFSKYNERCLDVAKFPCISCDKLCFKRECSQVNRLRSVPCNRNWDILFEFIESRPHFNDGLPTGYICHHCLEYFRSDKMPPRCILNGLDFGVVPEEIKVLNPYEKILIQRAKCFQMVTRMGTVAKKHLPSTHKIQKVCGTTFHLPLPLQETLKKLPETHQPLADTGELYILLRSIPSKKISSGKIW